MGGGKSHLYKNTYGALHSPDGSLNLFSQAPSNPLISEADIKELEERKENFTKDKVIMTVRDYEGKIRWLEEGNDKAGLVHIMAHKEQFEKGLNIKASQVPAFIQSVIREGTLLSFKINERGPEYIYRYKNKNILCVIGTNGFIVSVYITNKSK